MRDNSPPTSHAGRREVGNTIYLGQSAALLPDGPSSDVFSLLRTAIQTLPRKLSCAADRQRSLYPPHFSTYVDEPSALLYDSVDRGKSEASAL